MRNLIQPPPSMHCELCDGELRFKRIEPDDPAFDMEVENIRLLQMRPCALAPGNSRPLCRTHREKYGDRRKFEATQQSRQHRPESLLARPSEPNPQAGKHFRRCRGSPTGEPGIATHPRRGGQDRDRQQPGQQIPAPARIPRIRHRGEYVEEIGSAAPRRALRRASGPTSRRPI